MTALAPSRGEADASNSSHDSLWTRQLSHYPSNARRYTYLAITVLATIVLYYELYVQGAVATQIITSLHMSFGYFVGVSIVGNAVGALASIGAGMADRWGRANMVVYGLAVTGAIIAFGLPNAGGKSTYLALFAVLSVVEGIVLVATPALVRDFSPQIGRASAMGFWTLGPVLGSLAVTAVSSNTLTSHPDWQFQFHVCGVAGLVVFVIAFAALRELSPRLRDQLMVSHRERLLVEARAAGLDPEAALSGHWKQMLRPDIVGPAFAISIFLMFYYVAVGFFVVYLATAFGYSAARANALANWYWITNAIALVITGALSDRLRVRKPFMILGGVVSAVAVAVFALEATHPDTSYYTLAAIITVISAGGGVAYCAWMAAFTETVEKHNPAATATGLAVWGGILRAAVTVILLVLTLVVSGANPLIDEGNRVKALATKYQAELATAAIVPPATLTALTVDPDDTTAQVTAIAALAAPITAAQVALVETDSIKYKDELATLAAIDPATQAALQANPTGPAAATAVGEIASKLGVDAATAQSRLITASRVPAADLAVLASAGPAVQKAAARLTALGKVPLADLAYLKANASKVQKAAGDIGKQWRLWWLLCCGAQVLFLPFVFLLTGRWNPKRAKADYTAHDADIDEQLRRLTEAGTAQTGGARA